MRTIPCVPEREDWQTRPATCRHTLKCLGICYVSFCPFSCFAEMCANLCARMFLCCCYVSLLARVFSFYSALYACLFIYVRVYTFISLHFLPFFYLRVYITAILSALLLFCFIVLCVKWINILVHPYVLPIRLSTDSSSCFRICPSIYQAIDSYLSTYPCTFLFI